MEYGFTDEQKEIIELTRKIAKENLFGLSLMKPKHSPGTL
jgi:hypothetical protein